MRQFTKERLAVLVMVAVMVMVAACTPKTFDMRLNLKQGEGYHLISTVTAKMDQEVMGQNISVDQTFHSNYLFTIVEKDKQSDYWLTAQISDASFADNASSYGEEFNMRDLGDEVQKVITDFKLYFDITKQGVINNLGFEKSWDKLLEQIQAAEKPDQTCKEANIEVISKFFSAEMLKQIWEYSFSYIPQKSVEIGESWVNEINTAGSMPFTVATTYTLQSVKEDEIVIAVNSDFDLDQPSQLRGVEVETHIQGSVTGEYIINRSSGWIKKGTLTQTLSGSILSMFGLPIEMPMNMTSTIEVSSE